MDDQQEHIDELLQRYLVLLDTYTGLRGQLSALQAGMYQHIARANFSAERGVRYGREYYDGRMRAVRVLEVRAGEGGVPVFAVRDVRRREQDRGKEGVEEETEEETEGEKKEKDEGNRAQDGEKSDDEEEEQEGDDQGEDNGGAQKARKKKSRSPGGGGGGGGSSGGGGHGDPLRWFGLFAPSGLRTAQGLAVQAVGEVVPRLVSLSAEMAELEIEVRRARKRRAKSAAAAERQAAAAAAAGSVDGMAGDV